MIQLSDVGVSFPDGDGRVDALRDVSLTIRRGEFVLVSGRSGSGKSTLLNVVAGLQRFERGTAVVAEVDVARASDDELATLRLEHVGVVFQENNLLAELTVQENVEVPLRVRGRTRAESTSEAIEMLELVGIGELGRRRPSQLSGGQRQRAGIARALAGGRQVLLADEPTGSLDSENSVGVFGLLRGLADRGVTVVVASHDDAAAGVADRVLEMRDGSISETSLP